MFNIIWRIRREGERNYEITLDHSSFAYDSFPESDRHWKNDNVEELMNKAREVTRTNIQSGDHYGKIEEYANIFLDVDEEVILEVRHEGENNVKASVFGLILLSLAILSLAILFLIILFNYFI